MTTYLFVREDTGQLYRLPKRYDDSKWTHCQIARHLSYRHGVEFTLITINKVYSTSEGDKIAPNAIEFPPLTQNIYITKEHVTPMELP